MSHDGYLLDNRDVEAGARFAAMSELFDDRTFEHIERLGLGPGWRCWEVGAGGTSIVRRLADRVGPAGRVVATDIDLTWMQRLATSVIEVRRHDVATDEPPEGPFDLVHARLVLMHLPARDVALRHMIAALRPGGRLLVEDADPALQPLACIDVAGPQAELANRVRATFRTLMAGRIADLAYGRKLPRLLREAGLTGVCADAYFPLAFPACTALESATVRLLRDELAATGLVTSAEIEQHLRNVASGTLDIVTAPMISAWGSAPPR